nr:uncharacterized protein LOC126054037 [Helicoverpa armigera]
MSDKKRLKYSQENMEKALRDIREKKMSINQAAKSYDIPKTTILDRLKDKYKNPGNIGGPTVLTSSEEMYLVKWILELGEVGFPITKTQLLDSVTKLIKSLGRQNPFKDDQPGKKWYNGFLARHPEVSKRVPQSLTTCRAIVSENNIRSWFSKIRQYFVDNKLIELLQDPKRIFNCDESGFYLSPQEKQVLVRKGSKKVYNRTVNDEKECLTVLLTVAADGAIPPPLIMFPYKRYVPSYITANMPKGWGMGHSDSGWMTSETFYEYITNVFHPWLKEKGIQMPVVLFLDGHSSHININLSEYCKEHEIILIAFYPNATHRLQPLDVGVFYPLKNCWRNDVREWRMANSGKKMQRSDFPIILHKSINATLSPAIIAKAFQTCGLYPFNEDAIDYSKLIKEISNEENNNLALSTANQHVTHKTDGSQPLNLLSEVEARLPTEVVNKFKNVDSEIDLDERFLELYKFWKNIQSEKNISMNESTFQNNLPSNLNQTISDIIINEEFWLANDDAVEATVESDGSLSLVNLISQPSTSKQDQAKDSDINTDLNLHDPQQPDYKTPVKKSGDNTTGSIYPTPFKNALFWPGNIEKKRKTTTDCKGQSKKPKMYPTVATSDQFMEYQRRVEAEKLAKENDKLERAQKKKEKSQQTKSKKKTKVEINTDITEAKEKMEYPEGVFVVVQYEGEYFPGIVMENLNDNIKVKTMTMSGSYWKWPEKDDILIYDITDIMCKIESPALMSSRGTYDVPKINQLRNQNNL